MPIQLDDKQIEVAKAVFAAFVEGASEPYNEINAQLGVSYEERDPTGGKEYSEGDDPVVQRVQEFARLIGCETPPVEEEPEE